MRLTAIALGLAFATTSALAQTGPAPSAPVTTEKFVQTVAMSDMFEIAISKVAQTKGTADEKSFARQMIHDHAQTSSEIKGLIASERLAVKLPSGLDREHQSALKSLKMLKGKAFAGSFESTQVKAHEEAIALLETYAGNGDNAALKAWAAKTLPTIKHHLQMAQGLGG